MAGFTFNAPDPDIKEYGIFAFVGRVSQTEKNGVVKGSIRDGFKVVAQCLDDAWVLAVHHFCRIRINGHQIDTIQFLDRQPIKSDKS